MPLDGLDTSAKLRLLMLLEEVLMVELLIEDRIQILLLLNLLLRLRRWRKHQPTGLRRELLEAELVMLRLGAIVQERSLVKVVQHLSSGLPFTRPRQRYPVIPRNLTVIRQLSGPPLAGQRQGGQIQQHQRHRRVPVPPGGTAGDIYRHSPRRFSANHLSLMGPLVNKIRPIP